MRTNIEIDDELMAKAQQASKLKTKKALVERGLELVISLENQKDLIDLWGKVEIDDKAYL